MSNVRLRRIALNPAYIGYRVHKPGVSWRKPNEGTWYKAIWPPIVDVELFAHVQRILTDPSRMTWRPGRGRYLVSMIARCDVCGGPLAGYAKLNVYTCHHRGYLRILLSSVEEVAERAIVQYLERDDVRELLAGATANEPELIRVRNELAEQRRQYEAYQVDAPNWHPEDLRPILARYRTKIADLEGVSRSW